MKETEPELVVNLRVDIPVEIMVANITRSLSREELADFIKAIDLEVAEYDFTEELKNYFVKEIEKEDKHG